MTDNSATTNKPDPRDEVIVLLGDYLVWHQNLLLETQEKAVKMADTHKEIRALAVTAAICEERKKYLSMITELQSSYTNLRNQVNVAYGEATSELHRQKFAQAQSEFASLSAQFDEVLVALSEADLCRKALFADRRKEVSLEYLPRQFKKNKPGTKFQVMVNEINELTLSYGMSALRCEVEATVLPFKCSSVPVADMPAGKISIPNFL